MTSPLPLFLMLFLLASGHFTASAQLAEVVDLYYSCQGENGGARIGILEGSQEDYYYVWSHDGREELYHDDLAPGIYYFYIEDRFGCKEEIEIEILSASGCYAKPNYYFDTEKCVYVVGVSVYNNENVPIYSPAVEITYDYNNLSGSPVELTIPQGLNSIELEYEYTVNGLADQPCCNKTGSLTIYRSKRPCLRSHCSLVVNEVVKAKKFSYVELLVVGNNPLACKSGCDVRNAIIDDNNGDLITDDPPLEELYSSPISKGYVSLNDKPSWEKVPVGSRIVLYRDLKNGLWEQDPTDVDQDGAYFVWIKDTDYIDGYYTGPQSELITYEHNGIPTTPDWEFIDFGVNYDGIQTYIPGSQSKHSVATGPHNIEAVGGSSTLPIVCNIQDTTKAHLCLTDDRHDLPGSYLIANGSISDYTPGYGNSEANQLFIDEQSKCNTSESLPTLYANKKDKNKQLSITVFPSPFYDEVKLSGESPKGGTVEITVSSLEGVIICKADASVKDGRYSVDITSCLSNLPSSMYLATAVNSQGEREVVKFIKSTNK